MAADFDPATIEGFGNEVSRFDQSSVGERELRIILGLSFILQHYSRLFAWKSLPEDAVRDTKRRAPGYTLRQ